MKLKHLFVSLFAAAAVFAGCEKEKNEDSGLPVISIENAEIEVAKEGGAPTVTFTANRDWTAKVQEGETWLGVSAASGKASADKQTITITVDPNDAFDRSATVTIALAGGLGSKDITVKQAGKGENPDVGGKGEGTLESPYDVAKALEVANALNDGEYTDTKVYVKGIVSSIKNTSGIAQYGNIDFYISDDGKDDAETRFLVFQSLYLGGAKFTSEDQLKVGDEVVIYGKLTNYMGNTPETEGKGQTLLYSINGTTAGGSEEVEQISCAEFIQRADVNTTYRLKGKITSAVNAQYCSFDMSDDEGVSTVVVWSVLNKDEWAGKVSKGGTVTVRGTYLKYQKDEASPVKHEMINATIEAFEEGEGGEDPDEPIDPSKLLDAIDHPEDGSIYMVMSEQGWENAQKIPGFKLSDGTVIALSTASGTSDPAYYNSGTTLRVYLNNTITIEGSKEISKITFETDVYNGTTYLGGDSKSVDHGTISIEGDNKVIISDINSTDVKFVNGHSATKDGQLRIKKLTIVYVGGTEPGEPEEPNYGEGEGEGTLESPYDAVKALNIAKSLDADGKEAGKYVKGKVSEVKVDVSYGNATYKLSVDGTTEGAQFSVFRGKYYAGEKFTSEDQLKVGDEVVVLGDIVNYQGNTPQLAANSEIISINGETAPEEPEEPGETFDVTFTMGDYFTADEAVTDLQLSETVSITCAKATGSSAPKYYANGKALRLYQNNTITLNCQKTIDKVVFNTINKYNGGDDLTTDNNGTIAQEAESITVSGVNAQNLTLTNGGKSNQIRLLSISIKYAE